MPRPAKPARLWLRPARPGREAAWVILDRGKHYSTGCGEAARGEAERRLLAHLGTKHDPQGTGRRPSDQTPLSDVLSVYLDDIVPRMANPAKAAARIDRLLDWWGTMMLSEVSPSTCRAYAQARNKGGARRDLEDLRSAVNHHARRGLHGGMIHVELPQKGQPRAKYLTRNEVARLLWVCWRYRREQVVVRGPRKGERLTGSGDHYDLRHLARFILLALYTGSRSGPILKASIFPGPGRAWLDVDRLLYHRLPEDAIEARNKRSPPSALSKKLASHVGRWRDRGIIAQFAVEWEGLPVKSIKTAWRRAVRLAGIEGHPTPHTLRHTAVTWMKQKGVSSFEVAGFVGMSERMVEEVYGKHDPAFQRRAADALAYRRVAK